MIEPLPPYKDADGRLLVELGSNAGFYLRKAKDLGYDVLGVEREDEFIAHAKYWEENDPKGVQTIQADLNDYRIPSCQVLLLAQVHYWLTPEEIRKLVRLLSKRALYVIVVGRQGKLREHVSASDMKTLIRYFDGWEQGKITSNYLLKHNGTIFKNTGLEEVGINDLKLYPEELKYESFIPAFTQLTRRVLDGDDSLNKEDPYYQYRLKRGGKYTDDKVTTKIQLIKDIKRDRLERPLAIGRHEGKWLPNTIYDGDHRYIIAKELGYKYLICKRRERG